MGRKPIFDKPMTPTERVRRCRAGQGGLPVSTATSDLNSLIASGKKYGAILADPPWPYETWNDKGKRRSAEQHYNTMSIDAIKALPVVDLAAKDCVLFLWVTCPQVKAALEVIEAWGFRYKAQAFVWVKQTWTRPNTEPCFLATRGKPRRKVSATAVHEVILAPVAQHSRKPDDAHYRIQYLVDGPYLELFARRQWPGWDAWGNEMPRSRSVPRGVVHTR